MKISGTPAINLSYGNAVAVLREACGLPPSGRAALEARIRQLQRAGVAAREGGQGRSRLTYGLVELAKLATAVRLMTAFMAPGLASRYVIERWASLAPFALAGAKAAVPAEYLSRRPIGTGTIAVFPGNALGDLGEKGRHDERHTGPLGEVFILEGDLVDIPALARGAGLVLDSSAFMPTIVRRAAEISMATDAELSTELDRLRFIEA